MYLLMHLIILLHCAGAINYTESFSLFFIFIYSLYFIYKVWQIKRCQARGASRLKTMDDLKLIDSKYSILLANNER